MALTKIIVVVLDQPLREGENVPRPLKVYGPGPVQRMGMHKYDHVRNRSQKNGMWICGLKHCHADITLQLIPSRYTLHGSISRPSSERLMPS
jgi:hypothetical protein